MTQPLYNPAGMAMGTVMSGVPATDAEIQRRLQLIPRYRVLLHNDDVTAMDIVVVALVRTIASLSTDDAIQIMLEAHNHGVAQVTICPKELAEHYRSGLESYGLTSTIEPA